MDEMDIEMDEDFNEMVEKAADLAAKTLAIYCDMHETCENCQFRSDGYCRICSPDSWDIRDEEV